MVTFNDVSFEFGGRFLYRDANWDIQRGNRIGLIGRNGTGKSTLLRLIVNEFQATEGTITRSNNLKIGFLNQDLLGYESNKTIFQVAQEAFSDILGLQKRIDELLKRLETEVTDEILHELGEAQEELGRRGGYEMDSKTAALLAGLGFSETDQHQDFKTFSGGWRMRAILAKLLLMQPDLLLLDEPTNHLDLPSIEWLENYLLRSGTTFVLVSHDREFLNRMVNMVIEVSHQKLHQYSGNYEFYLTEREQRRIIQQASFENQQKYIADTERFIERFKAKASKATQAQSRVKTLDKLERIQAPEAEEAAVSFRFQPAVRAGVDILSVQAVRKSFGEKHVLRGATAVIARGDKIGLIGANGVGKSTVLRILAEADSFEGERKLGYNVQPSFFAQHQLEALNPNRTILEECQYFALEKGETYVRSILGGFLFTGDDVHKKVKVLSGGERSRVALAKTLLSQANFLLLDEPTNHLDMQSIQILAQALTDYQGTYILVSHDRHFLRNTTNKIWYLEEGQIKEYPGPYAEYEEWAARRAAEAKTAGNGEAKPAPKPAPGPPQPVAAKPVAKPQLTEQQRKELKVKQNQLKKLEDRISELEQTIQNLTARLNDPANAADFTALATIERDRQNAEGQLERTLGEWERLGTELESVA